MNLFETIGENFGNGLTPLSSTIEEAWLELPSTRRRINAVAQALQMAVSQSHGAAIVNVGEIGIHQNNLIDGLPENYHPVDTKEIFSGHAKMPNDKTALVVTGYTKFPDYKKMQEQRIQQFVRATAAMRNLNEGQFSVLVLSDSLPDENIFNDASLPWFNGPFRDEGSVWSVRIQPNSIELIKFRPRSEILRDPLRQIRVWEDTQHITV